MGGEPILTEPPNEDSAGGGKGERLRTLIDAGAEIVGGAAGGAAGFLLAGPEAAIVGGAGGAAVVVTLKRIGVELSERLLGPREKIRTGAILTLAAAEINERIEQGIPLRADGFFEVKNSGRSDGDEVAEHVILKCQRDPQEKKLPYMAHLLATFAFDSTISAEMAHQLTKAAEQLTYRQFCLMKLSIVREPFRLRENDYRGVNAFSVELRQLLYECMDLYHRGFVSFGRGAALGPTDVVPGKMKVHGLGADLFNAMKLGEIPIEEITAIAALLK